MTPILPLLAASWLAVALLGATYTTPHLAAGEPPRTLEMDGQRYVDQGLVAAGSVPAGSLDFLGDTLGSFSSLAVERDSWKKTDGGYEGELWTLPDRGRNDPEAGLFYDYASRLQRYRIRLATTATGAAGRLQLVPDGGIELRDFDGKPFTGADPGAGTVTRRGLVLPAPASGAGAGKIALDAESLQFTADGHFYVGDEYAANVYYFDRTGRLQGVLQPPAAVRPLRAGKPAFGSLQAPDSGRRNNQGVEGMALSPDGRRLFVALQGALVQDSAKGSDAGRADIRVLVYDVSADPLPKAPIGHYLVQLPTYTAKGDGKPANKAAAQSELRALDGHRFLLLARDGNGVLGGDGRAPVYKSVLLVDTDGATNLAGSPWETGTASVLARPDSTEPVAGLVPARWSELLNLLDPLQLARAGLALTPDPARGLAALSEKWEAMDLLPALDPARPHDWLLLVGNDNDFIARHCLMQGQSCDSAEDNDNRILVYRLTLPGMPPAGG
ncbi:MAG: esterase-like activity of phytase family protein [Pseudoxanthomonas sp.]